MHAQLPLEVTQLIILYIPFTILRLLCEEDDSLKSLIAPVLYRYVSYGHFIDDLKYGDRDSTKFYNLTYRELYNLASGNIDVKIRHFKICDGSMKLWTTVRDSSAFLRKIPIIDYEGSQFDMCMRFLPVQNLRHLSTSDFSFLKGFKVNAFPPNITGLTIDVDYIISMPNFPKSLRDLTLHCQEKTNLVLKFPPNLELFSHLNVTFNDKLPDGLLKLVTDDVYNVTLPDSLVELNVLKAYAPLTFPPGLKKLKLHGFDNLVGMLFPNNLMVLDLADAGVTTLDGIVFPSLLRELRLEGNTLKSLDNVVLPELIFLDISFNYEAVDIHLHPEDDYVIKSLSRVQFPKLECLIARDQPVKDWSITTLPETLEKLVMTVMEEPRTLKFPPFLKVLKIYFSDDLAEYSELRLPETLEELRLHQGVSSIFEWNLPQLRTMKITRFTGPIKVPDSVVDLCLQYKNHELREEIQIPPNVEKLEIPYLLDEYPTTVTNLTIYDCDVKSFALPPYIESVHIERGNLDGRSFTPPNTLNYFHGGFDEELNTPPNWDTDSQIYCGEEGRTHPDCPIHCTIIRG